MIWSWVFCTPQSRKVPLYYMLLVTFIQYHLLCCNLAGNKTPKIPLWHYTLLEANDKRFQKNRWNITIWLKMYPSYIDSLLLMIVSEIMKSRSIYFWIMILFLNTLWNNIEVLVGDKHNLIGMKFTNGIISNRDTSKNGSMTILGQYWRIK